MKLKKDFKISDKTNTLIKLIFVLSCTIFCIPTLIYIFSGKSILEYNLEYKFLLNASNELNQTIIYIAALAIITILYVVIIKKRKELFSNIKQILKYVLLVSAVFLVIIPFTSSDVFYYLGIGRLDGGYNQNPYYTSIDDFVNENIQAQNEETLNKLSNDTAIQKGISNVWSDTTVVYGALWTLICKIIGIFSFGNVALGLLIFKLLNIAAHLICCYLLYKITKKKIFPILYGLNPFILLEAIANVHNDIFIVLFVLFAIYFLKEKKNILISVIFLALATAIKYVAVLLLPFFIIYFYKNKKPKEKFLKCIEYGLVFIIVFAIPYLFYIKDLSVLNGIFAQQDKIAKGIYLLTQNQILPNISGETLKMIMMYAFIPIYGEICIVLLFDKKIMFNKLMQKAQYILIAFL